MSTTASGLTRVPGRTRLVNPWIIAPVVAMAAFMEVLDISIANVSLQHIAGSLSASQEEATWVLTSYLVSNAIVLPISGWMSSVFGRKRFFMGCIAGFTVSSLLCGFAPNLVMLIVFRTLQGATGGGLQPSAQAILSDSFPPEKRGMAFGLYGLSVVFAPAIGPTLGGWITDNFSWRWVFFINVPVGIILISLALRLIHDPRELVRARLRKLRQGIKVDYIGFALLSVGLGFLQIILDKGQQDDWFQSRFILTLSAISAIALILLVFRELRLSDPIVDLHLLRDRNFGIANLLMLMLGFILLGSTVVIPIYVQTLLGYTAEQAGLVISPGGFAIMLLMPTMGLLVSRFEPRWLIVTGLVIAAYAMLRMTGFDTQTDYSTIVWARVLQAIGLAFLFIPINTAAYVAIPTEKSSNASAIINLSRNLGGSIGISLITTQLARRSQIHQNMLVGSVNPYNPQYQSAVHGIAQRLARHGSDAVHALHQAQSVIYAGLQKQASMLAFIDVFRMLAVIFIALIPFVFLLKKGRPGQAPASH